MSNNTRVLYFIVFALLLAQCVGLAQASASPGQDKRDYEIIRFPVRIVLIEFVVHDKADRDVGDLGKDDFKCYEDGTEQTILFWQRFEISSKWRPSTRYRIAYYPKDEQLDDNLRRIDVAVKAKGETKYTADILAKGDSVTDR